MKQRISEAFSEQQSKIEEEVRKALERIGVDYNELKNPKRRFSKIMIEHQGDVVSYYYDDGSLEGLLILSATTQWEHDLDNFKMGFTTNYRIHV